MQTLQVSMGIAYCVKKNYYKRWDWFKTELRNKIKIWQWNDKLCYLEIFKKML